jgi:hypothetical protein
MRYKNYLIETFQSSPQRWRARLRRIDGRKIKILVTGNERDSITTDGMEGFSPEDAMKVAIEIIDGPGMS